MWSAYAAGSPLPVKSVPTGLVTTLQSGYFEVAVTVHDRFIVSFFCSHVSHQLWVVFAIRQWLRQWSPLDSRSSTAARLHVNYLPN